MAMRYKMAPHRSARTECWQDEESYSTISQGAETEIPSVPSQNEKSSRAPSLTSTASDKESSVMTAAEGGAVVISMKDTLGEHGTNKQPLFGRRIKSHSLE
jgi:hypothetical protein